MLLFFLENKTIDFNFNNRLKKIELQLASQNMVLNSILEILKKDNLNVNETPNFEEDLGIEFPLTEIKSLSVFNENLNQQNFYNLIIKKMNLIAGQHIRILTKRIVDFLFSRLLLSQICWKGVEGKPSITEFKNVLKIISSSVLMKYPHEKEFANIIEVILKNKFRNAHSSEKQKSTKINRMADNDI